MFFKKEEPKLEFASLLPGVEEIMPITKASTKDIEWMKKAQEDFKSRKDEYTNLSVRNTHIVRCHGIVQLLKTGYVHRAWQDITIETNGDGDQFAWNTPISQKEVGSVSSSHVKDYVNGNIDLIQNFTNDFRNLRSIIKIQSPWIVYVPKGYNLLITPMPYPDHQDFESTWGILPHMNGAPISLTAQLRWFKKEGTSVIKAGTPLHQMFLLKDEEVSLVCRAGTDKDEKNMNLTHMAMGSSFLKKFGNLKRINWK